MEGRDALHLGPALDFPAEQIVHIGAALGQVQQAGARQEQVVVHDERSEVPPRGGLMRSR